MPLLLINTLPELEKWLSENNYFENGYILEIENTPLSITFGYIVSGTYEANTERHVQAFKLEPSKVIEWTYDESQFAPSSNYCIEGIDAIDSPSGFGLSFVHAGSFSLVTDRLKISGPTIIRNTFKPWTSDKDVYAVAEIGNVPLPQFWLEKLKEKGHDLFYRYIYGEIKPVEQIPYPDYSGYYLQQLDRIKDNPGGIFISHLKQKNEFLTVAFENQDKCLADQWRDLTRIIANFNNVIIHSGNCKFSGPGCEQFLKDGILPVSPFTQVT
jgi:hypothetical protein